jgi:hypothetical protein
MQPAGSIACAAEPTVTSARGGQGEAPRPPAMCLLRTGQPQGRLKGLVRSVYKPVSGRLERRLHDKLRRAAGIADPDDVEAFALQLIVGNKENWDS